MIRPVRLAVVAVAATYHTRYSTRYQVPQVKRCREEQARHDTAESYIHHRHPSKNKKCNIRCECNHASPTPEHTLDSTSASLVGCSAGVNGLASWRASLLGAWRTCQATSSENAPQTEQQKKASGFRCLSKAANTHQKHRTSSTSIATLTLCNNPVAAVACTSPLCSAAASRGVFASGIREKNCLKGVHNDIEAT